MGASADRRRSPRLQLAAILLAVGAGGLVYWLSNTYFPYHSIDHREAVYLQQAALLLDGHLAMTPPVADVFRPWLYTPVDGKLYPPATPVPAAMFAVGQLLGGTARLSLAFLAAGNVLLMCAIGAELFDPPTGLLAGGLLVTAPLFLLQSAVFLPYAPTMLWLLLFVYAYLVFVRTDGGVAPVLAGLSVGIAGFARPYITILIAAPFGIHAGYTLGRSVLDAEWRQAGEVGALVAVSSLCLGGTIAYRTLIPGVPGLLPVEPITMADGLGYVAQDEAVALGRVTVLETLQANAQVLGRLFTTWGPVGLLGTVLAGIGLGLVIGSTRRQWPDFDRRTVGQLTVAGIVGSVSLGNLVVPATQALLGDPRLAGDGLLTFLGPYYHIGLLLPLALFGAHGLAWLWAYVRMAIDRFDTEAPDETAIVVGIVGAVLLATAAGAVTMPHLRANDRITDQYADAYSPLIDRSFDGALVFVPTPYEDRLNYPFQFLRNDPDFDGNVVYAIDAGPRNFETVAAFPDRTTYRYVYRGRWAPTYDQGVVGHLQRVTTASGRTVRLQITFDIPDWIEHVSIHLSAGDAQRYYGLEQRAATSQLTVVLRSTGVRVTGPAVEPVGNATTVGFNQSDYIGLDIFLNAGAGGGASYRALFPVRRANGTVRTMTPYLELCRSPSWCGGEAAYIPGKTPEGLAIETELTAANTSTQTASVSAAVPAPRP
ncbi:MAG: ArnT family glycosyltransferase [Halobacteriales archaeon]